MMLISDIAGMGKSTVLTQLSKQTQQSKKIRQNFQAKRRVRIELNDHTYALKELKKQTDKKKSI